jgi:O-antigen ligase
VLFSPGSEKYKLFSLPGVSLDRALLILILCMWIIQLFLKTVRLLPLTLLEKAMGIFFFYGFISIFVAGDNLSKSFNMALGDLFYLCGIPFLIFFITKNIKFDQNKLNKVMFFFFLIGLYLGFTAICEQYRIHALIFPRYIDDPSIGLGWGRARGPFLEAGANGIMLGISILISIYFLLRSEELLKKILFFLGLLIMMAGLFYTKTRACWLGAFLSFVYLYFQLPKARKYLLACGIASCVLGSAWWVFSLGDKESIIERFYDETASSRINLLKACWNMFLDRPLFGFGFDSFQKASLNYFDKIAGIRFMGRGLVPHNFFAGILAEMGLVGLVVISWIYLKIYKVGIDSKRWGKMTEDKTLLIIFRAMCIIYFINALSFDIRYIFFVNSFLMFMAGITARVYYSFKAPEHQKKLTVAGVQ